MCGRSIPARLSRNDATLMKSHAPLLATGAVLAAVAGGLRLAQAWRVPVPSTDGASYLWIAEALARGDFVAGLDHVFHPGAPLTWVVAATAALIVGGAGLAARDLLAGPGASAQSPEAT